jgi:hypothetical protein
MTDKTLHVLYENHRGVTAVRHILPHYIWFGSTEWHPQEQWFLNGLDLDKGVERSFTLRDMKIMNVPSSIDSI